ncbi:transposase (fragment) [Brochothrix thermosphacta]|uniref:Transposase n=1 Tax=Brochothrix thermosphacta TaxID=2756 RepID=A0A2X0QHQ9_BROTH
MYLANKYELKDKKQILRWVNIYKEFGKEGLFRKRQNQKYSVQFKLDAIELYQTSEISYRDVANAIGINNAPLIASWMRKFREDGVDGFSKTKGRPSNKSKKKKAVKKVVSHEAAGESDRIKDLEKQVRSLKIEKAAKTESPTMTQESVARIIDSLRGSFKLVELL